MTDLFNDPKKNTQNAAAHATASTAKPEPTIKEKKKKKYGKTDYLWLAGLALGGCAVLYFLNTSDTQGTSNTTGQAIQARQPNSSTSAGDYNETASSGFREQVSEVLMQQNERINDIDTTSKQGLTVLSNQLKVANKEIAALKEQMQVLQLKNVSSVNENSNYVAKSHAFNQQPQLLLKEFSINDLSNDLAWVKYKDKVYALRNGSVLGGVTVIAINVNQRLVETDKGLIR